MKEKLNTCIVSYFCDGEFDCTRFCVITPEGKYLITGDVYPSVGDGDIMYQTVSYHTASYQTVSSEIEIEINFKLSDLNNRDINEFALEKVVKREFDVENIIFVRINKDIYEGV